jgi:hypothetical protein
MKIKKGFWTDVLKFIILLVVLSFSCVYGLPEWVGQDKPYLTITEAEWRERYNFYVGEYHKAQQWGRYDSANDYLKMAVFCREAYEELSGSGYDTLADKREAKEKELDKQKAEMEERINRPNPNWWIDIILFASCVGIFIAIL